MHGTSDARRLTEFVQREDGLGAIAETRWHKAPTLALKTDFSTEDALVAALSNGLEHLSLNRACVRERAHEEGVHQMRVATRRLRSRLALYEDLIPAKDRARLQRELKWLIRRLGPARDLDVFVLEVFPRAAEHVPGDPNLQMLLEAAERMRDRSYSRAGKALASKRYADLEALLGDWVERRPWRTDALDPEAVSGLDMPVREFARSVVQHRHDDLLTKGDGFATMAWEDRHQLRIEIKKVRYAAEFLGSLFPVKRVTSYLKALKELQEDLGAANDRIVARQLTMDLAERAPKAQRLTLAYAAGLVIASQPPVTLSEAASIALWEGFAHAQPYWV